MNKKLALICLVIFSINFASSFESFFDNLWQNEPDFCMDDDTLRISFLDSNKEQHFTKLVKFIEDNPKDFIIKVVFSNCKLQKIPPISKYLPNITKLLVTDSKLKEINPEDLHFKHLHLLYLNNNELTTIPWNAFKKSPNIKKINLSYNKIRKIDTKALESLKKLSSVALKGNACIDKTFMIYNQEQLASAMNEIAKKC